MITQADLQARLDALATELKVPGAAVAVAKGDQVVTAVTGLTNVNTGTPVLPETLFAAGSVTKVFTATLVMTLVDDGLIELDAPVQSYLPTFTVSGDPRSADVTVRMLLNHTSGLPGNFTFDIPKSPDVVTQFVDKLREYEFNSPPGAYWSYSNAGLVTLGRLAEVATGQTWDAALAERVLRPLRLNASTITEEIVLGSVAVGHLVDPVTGAVTRTPRFQLGSNGPSGSSLWCDIAALVAFGRMHLSEGRADDGKQVLSAAAVAEMQRKQADVPWATGVDEMGLGWTIRRPGDTTVLNHTGASAGQHSTLSVLPEQQGIVAALTNSTNGVVLYSMLAAELLQQEFGVTPPAPPVPSAESIAIDPARYVGVYVADEGRSVITAENGVLRVEQEFSASFLDVMRLIVPTFAPQQLTLQPYDTEDRFTSDGGTPVSFVTPTGASRPEFVYVGRIFRRV